MNNVFYSEPVIPETLDEEGRMLAKRGRLKYMAPSLLLQSNLCKPALEALVILDDAALNAAMFSAHFAACNDAETARKLRERLMGIEKRITDLRFLLAHAPTNSAAKPATCSGGNRPLSTTQRPP